MATHNPAAHVVRDRIFSQYRNVGDATNGADTTP